MDEKNILEVKDLNVHFRTEDRSVHAVKNVSFELERGKTLGIVGESGSGKSVTSLSVMQLIPSPPGEIRSGEIWFDSPTFGQRDLLSLNRPKPQPLLKRIAGNTPPSPMNKIRGNEISMIFQEPMTSLNPVFTCGDQVMETIRLHQNVSKQEAKDRTLELFNEVLLPRPEKNLKAYPHQISGGQKQRVMIAMAMACNPRILIADEPTTALDVTVQKTILRLMERLRSAHDMSIIFITHDLGVIAEIADEVLVMYKGNVVERGEVRQIFQEPKHPYTKGLIACRPTLEGRMKKLPTVADFMEVNEAGDIVEKPASVAEAIKSVTVSDDEFRARQKELQAKTPILEVNNLRTWFPVKSGLLGRTESYVRAVDDVSFQVYPGETLGLVGESGCGKTTLGRSLLRLVEPTAGHILFQNQDLMQYTQHGLRSLRKDFQIIFQDPYGSLNPRMTVGNAIMEPMTVHNLLENKQARKDKVYELLERVDLPKEVYNRYPHEFSGGQRQRICIARTLALNPKFVILDESVSALDVSVQAQVLNLLIELREAFGLTYIFISHDLSVVKFMSDRMMVMKEGKVVERGLSDDIYANPSEEYTQKLIDAIPRGRMEDIEAAIERRKQADTEPAQRKAS